MPSPAAEEVSDVLVSWVYLHRLLQEEQEEEGGVTPAQPPSPTWKCSLILWEFSIFTLMPLMSPINR